MSLPREFLEDLSSAAEYFAEVRHDDLAAYCESPIEALFATAFLSFCAMRSDPAVFVKGDAPAAPHARWYIRPQVTLLGYRVDFVIGVFPIVEADKRILIVECDGHEFHERTPEQAARDRSRDRQFQSEGIKIFRFTGREIHRQPIQCVADALKEVIRMVEGCIQ